jgi:hypothetical protein
MYLLVFTKSLKRIQFFSEFESGNFTSRRSEGGKVSRLFFGYNLNGE